MNGLLRPLTSLLCGATVALLGLPGAGALAAETPLPASNYTTRDACAASSPLHASCLAVQLVPLSAQAQAMNQPIGIVRASRGTTPAALDPAAGDFGLRPADLRTAYELPETAGAGQTVALIDAYNDLTAEADLASYSSEFGLPACTTANGCFKKVGEGGSESSLPFPKTRNELEAAEAGNRAAKGAAEQAIGWGAEISLDIETTHAVCPNCHIILVEANTTSFEDLNEAEATGERLGATELSNSWGGSEEGLEPSEDEASAFDDPGVVITASSGDNGYLGWDARYEQERGFVGYPAASPHVVAVGGTRLTLGAGSTWSGEAVWNGSGASGGGCSVVFTAPLWQQNAAGWPGTGCARKRLVADVSADADPHTGVAVTDSSSACESEGGEGQRVHWCTYGGTSLASPIIASVFALAGGAHGVAYPARSLYENDRLAPATLHDVTSGSNGICLEGFNHETGISDCEPAVEARESCKSKHKCLAGTGFDGPTGVGTPHGILAFQPGEDAGIPETEPEQILEEESPEEIAGEGKGTREGAGYHPPAGSTSSPTPSPGPVATQSSIPAVVSALGLTTKAVIALDARHPSAAKVSFFYTLSAPARVNIALAHQVRAHHRRHWKGVGSSTTALAPTGRNVGHLRGSGTLSPGLYRLTVTPASGHPKAIYFHIN